MSISLTYQTAKANHSPLNLKIMNIPAKALNAINHFENILGEVSFHNYKDGVLSLRVNSEVNHIEGVKVVSCNHNNGAFILKVKI